MGYVTDPVEYGLSPFARVRTDQSQHNGMATGKNFNVQGQGSDELHSGGGTKTRNSNFPRLENV